MEECLTGQRGGQHSSSHGGVSHRAAREANTPLAMEECLTGSSGGRGHQHSSSHGERASLGALAFAASGLGFHGDTDTSHLTTRRDRPLRWSEKGGVQSLVSPRQPPESSVPKTASRV
ncbi:unnamed protein product [Boreogadus saida]